MSVDKVSVPAAHFNSLQASAAAVPEMERRALVAGLMKHSAPRPAARVSRQAPAVQDRRKAKRKAQKHARRHNRSAR